MDLLKGWMPKSSTPVVLHIYDLGKQLYGVNVVCKAIGTGAFHAGVEVYDREWSYGGGVNGPSGSGVFCCRPRGCDAHSYREAVPMGTTAMSKSAVEALIKDLAKKWKGAEYDLLRHNCCHFSDALCIALGVGHVPGWVTSLAGVGAMLRSGTRLAAVGAAAVPQLAVQGFTAVAELLAGPDPEEERQLENAKPLEEGDSPADARRPDPMRCQIDGQLKDADKYAAYAGYIRRAPEEAGRVLRDSAVKSDGTPSPRSPAPTSPPSAARMESEHAGLAVGDAIEVFSNSRQLWCSGEVKSVDLQGSPPAVEVIFWLPGSSDIGTGEMAAKKVALGSKDLRKLQRMSSEPAPSWSVGDLVEVFSNSKNSWCSGRITQVSTDKVKVVYQPPGASPDDWLEKELMMGSDALRKAQLSEIASPVSPKKKLVWSEAEEAAYKSAFSQLRPKKQTPPVLDANVLAEYLKTSKLPRKVLKEIWKASVKSATQADFEEFGSCCRLVAHCQKALKERDQATIEVMEQAGVQFKQLLLDKFVEQAPAVLPDFYAGPASSGY